ncbi:MAG: beta/gamma crystallin-related protein [Pseudomonadota bacterium]
MKPVLRLTLTAIAALMAGQAFAEVTFFERENFQGRSYTAQAQVVNLQRAGFNDRASSAIVGGGRGARWEVCEDARFGGRCMILRPGHYPSLSAMGLNDRVSSVKPVGRNGRDLDERMAPAPLPSQVTFYENEGFQGRTFSADQQVEDFSRTGFNDRASSVVVLGQRWEVCNNARFGGDCMVLNPGRYPSLAAMGINDRISSVRALDWNVRVDDRRYAPAPTPVYDNRRRQDERIFEANVTSVRAVVGPPEQRCWMEREEVAATRGEPNVGGAVLGALIGGVLGHQVGGGVGKDLATAGGAVAGGVIGSNVGRNNSGTPATTRDVQKCATRPSNAAPAFWDVSYNFRGVEHRIQMTTQPGPTIPVNAQGEPRS